MDFTEGDAPDWSQFVIEVGGVLQLMYGVITCLRRKLEDGRLKRLSEKFGDYFQQYQDIHEKMEPLFNREEKERLENIENTLLVIVGLIDLRGKGYPMTEQMLGAEEKFIKMITDLQNQKPTFGSQKRSRVLSDSSDVVPFKAPRLRNEQQEYAEEDVYVEDLDGYESEQESDIGMGDSTRTNSENGDVTDEEQDDGTQASSSNPAVAKKGSSGGKKTAKQRHRSKGFSARPTPTQRKAKEKAKEKADEKERIFLNMQEALGEHIERMTTSEAKEKANFWNSMACQLSMYQGKSEADIAALPTDVREFFDKIRNENTEQRCLSHETSREDATEYVELFENYRNLDGKFEDMFFSVHPENQERLTSEPSLPPTIKFATKLHLPPGTAGKEIIQTINDRKTVYSTVTEGTPLFKDAFDIVNKEIAFYNGKGINQGSKNQKTISTPIINAESMEEDELEKALLTFPISLVSNIKEAWHLDGELFGVSALLKDRETYKVNVLRQLPQPTSSNFNMDLNYNVKQFSNQMLCLNTKSIQSVEMTLAEFCENYEKLREATRKTFDKLAARVGDHEKIMKDFGEEIKDIAIPLGFLTNFDLIDDVLFMAQIASISRLPRFLQPSGHGGFLDFSGETLWGLNRAQVYIKPPGARTSPHLENNGLTSINISFGEGDCVWFAVPFEHSARFEKFIRDRLGLENDNEKLDLESLMYHNNYWPNEFELLAAGIPLYKFVQKPYQMVFVNYGTYHWVQSNGFCVNLSWNVAQNNYFQLATAGLTHDHFTNMKKQALMPIEHIVWRMVEEKVKVEKKLYDLIVRYMMRSIAHAEEERLYLVQQGIPVKKAEAGKLRPVERCVGIGCEDEIKKIIFNYVAKRGDKALCLECFSKQSKKKGFVVYEVREIGKLVELYDNYKFDTLGAGPLTS